MTSPGPGASGMGRRIARAAWMVSAGILLSRLLGFARNVVLANRLGDTPLADAYEAAFIIPDFLNYLLAGGFLAITFIPILSRYLAQGDEKGGERAFNAVFWPILAAVILLTIAAVAAAGWIVELAFGSGDRLAPDQLREVTRLTRMVLPAQVCFVAGGLFMAVQYARGRFLIPTLAPVIYNLGIIIGGWAGIGPGGTSADGFILGAVGGALAGNLALQWWGARRTGLRVTAGPLNLRHPALREYLIMAVPLMIGQSIVVLDESLGKVVAASAADGSIFALNLARRVNMAPVGMIAQAAGVAAYPYLARLVAEGRRKELSQSLGSTMRTAVFIGGAATAATVAVSQPAVRVFFQHGEFSSAGTILTAAALIGYSLSIPAWVVHQVLARGFYSYRQMWVPVLAGTAWMVPAVPMFLIGFRMGGVAGIAVASSAAITGHALTLVWLWRRRHSGAALAGLARTGWQTAAAAAIAATAGWLAASALTDGRIPDFGTGVGAAAVGLAVTAAVYLIGARLLGSREAAALLSRLRKS